MTNRDGVRIYRTANGRHVLEGDPDAAFLAYSAFEVVPDAVMDEVTASKKAPKPADKAATKPADKSTAASAKPGAGSKATGD